MTKTYKSTRLDDGSSSGIPLSLIWDKNTGWGVRIGSQLRTFTSQAAAQKVYGHYLRSYGEIQSSQHSGRMFPSIRAEVTSQVSYPYWSVDGRRFTTHDAAVEYATQRVLNASGMLEKIYVMEKPDVHTEAYAVDTITSSNAEDYAAQQRARGDRYGYPTRFLNPQGSNLWCVTVSGSGLGTLKDYVHANSAEGAKREWRRLATQEGVPGSMLRSVQLHAAPSHIAGSPERMGGIERLAARNPMSSAEHPVGAVEHLHNPGSEAMPPRIIVDDKKAPAAFRRARGYWVPYRGYNYNLNSETAHHFWVRGEKLQFPARLGRNPRHKKGRSHMARHRKHRRRTARQRSYLKLVKRYGVKGAARRWRKRSRR